VCTCWNLCAQLQAENIRKWTNRKTRREIEDKIREIRAKLTEAERARSAMLKMEHAYSVADRGHRDERMEMKLEKRARKNDSEIEILENKLRKYTHMLKVMPSTALLYRLLRSHLVHF
jgi:hypothetical protein